MSQGLSYALNRRFQELFDSAVDKALLLLGESGRQAAYYYLEETFGLKRDKWHSQVEEFAEAVEQIFGRFGAQLLLKAIAKELYSNIGLKFHDPKEFNFTRLVHEAKRNFLLGGGLLRRRKGVRKRRRE